MKVPIALASDLHHTAGSVFAKISFCIVCEMSHDVLLKSVPGAQILPLSTRPNSMSGVSKMDWVMAAAAPEREFVMLAM